MRYREGTGKRIVYSVCFFVIAQIGIRFRCGSFSPLILFAEPSFSSRGLFSFFYCRVIRILGETGHCWRAVEVHSSFAGLFEVCAMCEIFKYDILC